MTCPRPEPDLHAAALAGDALAWRALYDAAYDPVRRYLRWRVGGRSDVADELAQVTWLVAVARLRHFDPAKGRFPAWVCGIAANAVRNHLRRRKLETLAVEPAVRMCDAPERIAEALAALPERYEDVLRRKYLDAQSVDEIAAATGDSPKAVESLLSRAREAFRTAYASDTHE